MVDGRGGTLRLRSGQPLKPCPDKNRENQTVFPRSRSSRLILRDGRQNLRDHTVDVRIRREVIHDAGTQTEFSF